MTKAEVCTKHGAYFCFACSELQFFNIVLVRWELLLYASQNGYDRLMNEVHHDGNIKENRIAAEDRSAVERGPCAVGLGRVDAAVFQGHHLCVPRY